MSFHSVSIKSGSVGTNPISIYSTAVFNFATTDLVGAQKAIVSPTSASLRISSATTAPTTNGIGIAVTSGTVYDVVGVHNVAKLFLVAQTTSANVTIELQK